MAGCLRRRNPYQSAPVYLYWTLASIVAFDIERFHAFEQGSRKN